MFTPLPSRLSRRSSNAHSDTLYWRFRQALTEGTTTFGGARSSRRFNLSRHQIIITGSTTDRFSPIRRPPPTDIRHAPKLVASPSVAQLSVSLTFTGGRRGYFSLFGRRGRQLGWHLPIIPFIIMFDAYYYTTRLIHL